MNPQPVESETTQGGCGASAPRAPSVPQLQERVDEPAELTARDALVVQRLLNKDSPATIMRELGVTMQEADEACSRAVAFIQFCRATLLRERELAASEPADLLAPSEVTEFREQFERPDSSDRILGAALQLAPRSLAALSARAIRRLLPFAVAFARDLSRGQELLNALSAELDFVERFAEGSPAHSGLIQLAPAIEDFEKAARRAGEGVSACLLHARALFPLLLREELPFDIFLAFKATLELDLPGFDKATAADAARLGKIEVDQGVPLIKLGPPSGSDLLGSLWPEGEPEWYRTRMSEATKSTQPENADPVEPTLPDAACASDRPMRVNISAPAFLKSMCALFWTAFRHPFLTTEIDLSTGQVVRQY